ncbi:MAG: acetyl-CoA carboxylase carboxyl transferase subunit alpha, partial [Kiritimatiellia bacterium]|nr:acetyl-CoA carboxylase carboxyl transferase subunit alpha [Kiritimatiellia bacterium]
MAAYTLPFEKPVLELEEKLRELRRFSESQDIDVSTEIQKMEEKIREARHRVYDDLTPWQNVLVARHPLRPYTRDYIQAMTADFVELHGDRVHADDRA